MSYKWPDKDKDEIVDYSVDWSRFLGDDTIGSVTWYLLKDNGDREEASDTEVIDGLQFVSDTISGQVTTIRLSLGENNKRYRIACRITTGEGLQYERSVYLRIKEK